MNRIAYRTTGLAVKALTSLSRARVRLHGTELIPEPPAVFVINHFTRLETVLMPYLIHRETDVPVWTLADAEFFREPFGQLLDHLGAVSTRDPDRDRLIVKTLLRGDAYWIIFPEGCMVKTLKFMDGRRFMVARDTVKRPPHTGPAALGMRAELVRARLNCVRDDPGESRRVLEMFDLDAVPPRIAHSTRIVPVNISYYPVRARENALIDVARRMAELPERVVEELMTEGSMLLSGVDVDVRFGAPIPMEESLDRVARPADLCRPLVLDFDAAPAAPKALRREAVRVMRRYMGAIYGLTTLNPDHLLASLLRSSPYARVERDDLARRLYLVATELQSHGARHLHPALTENPLQVLVDDPRGVLKEFLSLAVEKGYLRAEKGIYRREKASFRASCSFHRARIDTPLDGMANAVEPLFDVRRRVGRTALLPAFLVRRRVRERLMQAAVEEYVDDYRRHFIPGESKPIEVGMPFLVRGGRHRSVGVVLSHGYMAAPLEVKGLADYLGSRGFWVYVPRLRGHGTSPEDLATRSYRDWAASVDLGYAVMKTLCRRVIVGGFSTGGGLALDAAARIDDLAGVFSISAPLRLRDFNARFVPAVHAWNRVMDAARRPGAKMSFVENRPENPHINYLRNPVSGVREVERLMDELEGRLSAIRTPALVVQSERDPVVDPRGSDRIFKRLGSDDKIHVRFNYDRHGILLGDDCLPVYRTVSEFVARLA